MKKCRFFQNLASLILILEEVQAWHVRNKIAEKSSNLSLQSFHFRNTGTSVNKRRYFRIMRRNKLESKCKRFVRRFPWNLFWRKVKLPVDFQSGVPKTSGSAVWPKRTGIYFLFGVSTWKFSRGFADSKGISCVI